MSYLDNSGASYLWSKIKAAFAAKSHTHSASDVTSGTLGIANGGTGATTAAAARTALEVSPIGGLYYAVEETATSTYQYTPQALVYIKSLEKLYCTNKMISIGSDIPSQSDSVTLATEIVNNAAIISRVSPSVSWGDYSVGQYVRVGETLRRVTSAISVGDTIDDSNSVAVRVMNELADAKTAATDASNITSGILPIARGGSGQSGLVSEYVVANVATAGTGCSILGAQYHQWGKVAQLYIGIRCTSAKSSGNVLATIVSGKRPMMTTPLTNLANASQFCAVYNNGQVQAKSSLTAGAEVYVIGTYLLP